MLRDNGSGCNCSYPVCINTFYFACWNMDTWLLHGCKSLSKYLHYKWLQIIPIPMYEPENPGKYCRHSRGQDSCEQYFKVTMGMLRAGAGRNLKSQPSLSPKVTFYKRLLRKKSGSDNDDSLQIIRRFCKCEMFFRLASPTALSVWINWALEEPCR